MDPHPTPTHLLAAWVEIEDFSGEEQHVLTPQNCRQKHTGLWKMRTWHMYQKKNLFQLLVPQR